MPRLIAPDNAEVITIPGAGNFQFSAVRIEDLGATEYTLVTIICDVSGSVIGFASDLQKCIQSIIGACQKSPRAENLLVRLLTFNQKIDEVHGFKNLSDIDIADYGPLHCDGYTALYDASFDGIGATLVYAKNLVDQDFDCNGAVYIITDGCDNASSMTPSEIKKRIEESLRQEDIESIQTILVSLHDPNSRWSQDVKDHLEKFKNGAGLSQFVDIGEATPQKLAKLANFVSQSISSQSQALGTGAPSQSLSF